MKQSICLDGWFIVKQSISVYGCDFGVFFELQQLLLFFFTLSVFNCAPNKKQGLHCRFRRQGWDEIPV